MPRRNVFFLLLILALCVVLACSHPKVDEPTYPVPTTPIGLIAGSDALAIALKDIPSAVLGTSSVQSVNYSLTGGYWIVFIFTPSNFTSEELGWVAGPGIETENTGALPEGMFRQIRIRIERNTGEVLLRQISDQGLPTVRFGPYPWLEEQPWNWKPWELLGVVVIMCVSFFLIMRRRGSKNVPP